MKIQLVETEINEAIKQYIGTQGINLTDKELLVDLTAGRGTSGFTATIDITTNTAKVSLVEAKDVETNQGAAEETESVKKVDPETPLFGKAATEAAK